MNRKSLAVVAGVFAVLLTSLGVASAQGRLSTEAPEPSTTLPLLRSAPEWGIGNTITYAVDLANFIGFSAGDDAKMECDGVWRHCSGECILEAGLTLPTGALLTTIELDAYDANPIGQVSCKIMRCLFGGSCSTMGTVATGIAFDAGNIGPSLALAPAPTVDNLNFTYVTECVITGGNADTGFRGFRVFYQLQVKSAPGTATFGDVPTDHLFFQHIEALAASGITAGCGGGNFCPDTPVTRGQMAVFLAKALGLHWPY
jgi:hypothetical protein